jgi:uncharacterized protein YrrD
MQFKEGSRVYTADGKDVGRIDKVVMNPQTKELTHLVVRKGFLFTEDKVLPLSLVASANEDGLMLQAEAGNLDKLPAFEETHYIALDEVERGESDYADNSVLYWLPPYDSLGYPSIYPYPPPYTATTTQNIPENSVVLEEGTEVYSSNKELLGRVERILTDFPSEIATYFVLTLGQLGSEKKLVPMTWVKQINDGKLYLSVGKSTVERLVEYQPEKP